MLRIGLDVGSTTLKCVVINENDEVIYKKYERHFSQIAEKSANMLSEISAAFPGVGEVGLSISGSAGMGFAEEMDIPFVQEVYATRVAAKRLLPETDVVIELGGEDAKILFLTGALEVRMNGTCAGGTGAFIDQMATLLDITPEEMNELSKQHTKIYSIASRCGVFAKSDIQPLLNQGAQKTDISASIFAAVVSQTIAGLAQGREIQGNVVYLGGPLTFLSQLREFFDNALQHKGTCPENSLYYVSIGAALLNDGSAVNLPETIERIKNYTSSGGFRSCRPLFENEDEYKAFKERHKTGVSYSELGENKRAYIGIDAGSTTVKCVVINENEEIVFSKYLQNSGNPVPIVHGFLREIYEKFPDINIVSSACTGYGEEIIKNAFHIDMGIVETIAHFSAAKKYNPSVDFIIDIGGQDIKCFKIRMGAIDNIFLNEACSSGCGSFLQTFAGALGYSIEEFADLGIFADRPVDLGSRCTVFMNSSVKQAQKEGASIENISAGLSISVVKNALYKVIRVANAESLGKNIVVQGGTFLNDAVLRAFEQEIGTAVTRPPIAGLMGAYGAALYAKQNAPSKSGIISAERLRSFKHHVEAITCNGCQNRCRLTVNTFDDGSKFIGGNRCEKPLALKNSAKKYNLFDYKKELLASYTSFKDKRGTIGIPMGLNMFELYPFWHTFFKELGFGVLRSPESTRRLYLKGQHTIPSDTVCYPAKLMHGHVEHLLEEGVDAIFYPCLSYNLDEGLGDNHFNCPVVAYYPEVIGANVTALKNTKYIYDYLGLHRKRDFPKKIHAVLEREFGKIPLSEVKRATRAAFEEYYRFMARLRAKGKEYLKIAQEEGLPVIVLCGRPYHLDPEINHGIDKLICDCGAVLITEDSVSDLVEPFPTTVLNQWTYHSRLYAAAKFIADSGDPDINLVQLVSFGCGVDAITTDEVRHILESKNRIYTQIKIDEITNLGAVKIRLRSLFAAVEQQKRDRVDRQ
ncbi:MAG TPA: 2-hydroxyglutaryl-CoA dehydratase [Clostridiales bacterium]|jgi:predicted CoA-substrate-specific enzyme activase|nr:2-hydroxyglutaryl-CoA dehydratase [Clostridiales bacterium]